MLQHGRPAPNILFVMADQLRHDAPGYAGGAAVTPHLDGLAARSACCTAAYAQSPQCQPSRASLLTGVYPTVHRVWWNQCPLGGGRATLPGLLAGYRTGWFGKLDLLCAGDFDECWAFEDWRDCCGREVWADFCAPMGGPTWTGRLRSPRRLLHEDRITERALEFMGGPGPWFAGVSFYGPHPPYAAPEPYSGAYDPALVRPPAAVLAGRTVPNDVGYVLSQREWRLLIAQYLGSVSWIDDNVGRLLAAAGESAVVVFTADHGDVLGDHGLFSKGVYCYEGNTRVPLLLRAPGLPPRRYGGLVQSIDLLPTLLELAGSAAPEGLQGASLLPALAGGAGNEFALSMIGYGERLRMIRWGRYKYWAGERQERLFDLRDDPGEERDLRDRDLLGEARLRLLRALIAAEDRLPRPAGPG